MTAKGSRDRPAMTVSSVRTFGAETASGLAADETGDTSSAQDISVLNKKRSSRKVSCSRYVRLVICNPILRLKVFCTIFNPFLRKEERVLSGIKRNYFIKRSNAASKARH